MAPLNGDAGLSNPLGPDRKTGVWGQSDSGYGVAGTASTGNGVQGGSIYGFGVVGTSTANNGVIGISQQQFGVYGRSDAAVPEVFSAGVFGEGPNVAIYGSSEKGIAIWGHSKSGAGLDATSLTGTAIYAVSDSGHSVEAYGTIVVHRGNINVSQGTLNAPKAYVSLKHFKIDHPLDPANKYLCHASVESDERKNIYDGIATLDVNGEATIELPPWFEALNHDFRYQLTCIGAAAHVFVSHEIRNNRFKIAGGENGLRVSWQVTGIRQDATAMANPMIVEEDKEGLERGRYLDPTAFGKSAESSVYAIDEKDGQQHYITRTSRLPPPPTLK